jgi:hypothetical protein
MNGGFASATATYSLQVAAARHILISLITPHAMWWGAQVPQHARLLLTLVKLNRRS